MIAPKDQERGIILDNFTRGRRSDLRQAPLERARHRALGEREIVMRRKHLHSCEYERYPVFVSAFERTLITDLFAKPVGILDLDSWREASF